MGMHSDIFCLLECHVKIELLQIFESFPLYSEKKTVLTKYLIYGDRKKFISSDWWTFFSGSVKG